MGRYRKSSTVEELREATHHALWKMTLLRDGMAAGKNGQPVRSPYRTVPQRLRAWQEVAEALFEHLVTVSDLNRVLNASLKELETGVYENDRKHWSTEDDDALVHFKAAGETTVALSQIFGRSPGAVATRLSYLVGLRRLTINVTGQIVGTLDGEQVAGNFHGIVRH